MPPVRTIHTLALIDNDDDEEFFVRRTLTKAGIATKVIRLRSGRDAVRYFVRDEPFADRERYPKAELALLDINMPGFSGFEVLTWMKDRDLGERPFVAMLSSSDLAEDKAKALRLGANCYLTKPAHAGELFEFARAHGFEWLRHGAG